MTESLLIRPVHRPVNAAVILPGSKSITNRALILAALADGQSKLSGALFSDDTRYMAEALRSLGLNIGENPDAGAFEVSGTGGCIPASFAELYIGNAGTAARFLCAYAALGHGMFRIDGVERMRQRPIADLLKALCSLGVKANSLMSSGCPPVEICANGIDGGLCNLCGAASSQYLTALLQIAPYTRRGITVEIDGDLVSRPYVDITLRMMEDWGVKAVNEGYRRFSVSGGQRYTPRDYQIEPDASAASYFYAIAAVTGGTVSTTGLGARSIQGDIKFVDVLEAMGCTVSHEADALTVTGPDELIGVDVEMNGISDTVMTLAAIAPLAKSPTTIRNVEHIRHKETDRITALANELDRLGVRVEERQDGLTIHPAKQLNAATVKTYDDHRMAMSFAVLGLRSPGIRIENPGCVAKTFPGFFARLDEVCEPSR